MPAQQCPTFRSTIKYQTLITTVEYCVQIKLTDTLPFSSIKTILKRKLYTHSAQNQMQKNSKLTQNKLFIRSILAALLNIVSQLILVLAQWRFETSKQTTKANFFKISCLLNKF